MSRLVRTGLVAALVAAVVVTLAAALARAAGVAFQIPDGEERIPLPGFATVTVCFCLAGVVVAVLFQRRSARPADRFAWTAGTLTAISLVPPLLVGADAATAATLVGLHLLAALVMIPTLVRVLCTG